jgi:hypothetical protein
MRFLRPARLLLIVLVISGLVGFASGTATGITASLFNGAANNLGTTPTDGEGDTQVRASGKFGSAALGSIAAAAPGLAACSVTVDKLLFDELLGGGTELVPDAVSVASDVPARPGSKPAAAIFEHSTTRPSFRMELKSRDPSTGLFEFAIRLDRAVADTCPGGGAAPCAALTRSLRTTFSVVCPNPSAPDTVVEVTKKQNWCRNPLDLTAYRTRTSVPICP